MNVFNLCFGAMFLLVLLIGLFFLKNWDDHFGADADWKSETAGASSYNKMQVIVVWVIAMKLLLGMAIFH